VTCGCGRRDSAPRTRHQARTRHEAPGTNNWPRS